jgi:glycosyltransferase involved in cell wall biosynthesis
MTAAPALSVVLPIHNERDSIESLLEEIAGVLHAKRVVFEVVAVDDGSTDGTGALLRRLALARPWLRVVLLRRNCGQSAAMDAGFRAASGTLVATMDADGQNDPADLPLLMETMEREDADFVSGRRARRQDALILRKLPSRIANFIIRRVTRTRLRDLGCSLKLYRRELVEDLYLYGEMHRFIGVLVEGLGARSVEVDVNHRPRVAGKSKYGLGRAYKVILDLVTVWFMRGYATKPIYIFGGVGLVLGVLSAVLAGYVLYQKLALDIYVHRNPLFILAVMLAVIGVQFLVLGLLAEILVRTYFESRQRPSYHIRERINFDAPPPQSLAEPKPKPREARAQDSAPMQSLHVRTPPFERAEGGQDPWEP